jgi:DNA segregation ATPase FtsK/SpoIIIE, S-DNA-T family
VTVLLWLLAIPFIMVAPVVAFAFLMDGADKVATRGWDDLFVSDFELNRRLRAEVDKLDLEWANRCDADLARVVASIKAGNRDARLADWHEKVEARSVYESRQLVSGLDSIVDFRNRRRAEARRKGEEIVVAAARKRTEESYKVVADNRAAEQQALDAERAKEESRRQAERREAQAAEVARQKKLARPIPLARSPAGIVFGTKINNGEDLIVPVGQLQHMLIAGVSGSGKSVFTHQLLYQLARARDVERLVLIDLKGGVEFNRYRSFPNVKVVWEFTEVVSIIDELVQLMEERQDYLRDRDLQNWPGGRVVVVIDEYAEIQSDIDAADGKDQKATAKRLAGNLVRLARRARALGIILICALQKPTTDAMDSSLRTNLGCRICLRVSSSQLAASLLDELDDLPVDPRTLETGRFIYYDTSRGARYHMQAQIAPGVDLGEAA